MAAYLEPEENGRRVVLDKAVILFGRQAECDVVLTRSRKVSRKHCCIAQVGDKYIIRDLGSLNGVRVNGNRVRKETTINSGDEVMIGDVRYILRVGNQDRPGDNQPQNRAAFVEQPPKRSISGPKPPRALPSEDYPIIIDEDAEDVFESDTPQGIPVAGAADAEDYFEFDEDDVEILEDSNEREDSGWQVEALPE